MSDGRHLGDPVPAITAGRAVDVLLRRVAGERYHGVAVPKLGAALRTGDAVGAWLVQLVHQFMRLAGRLVELVQRFHRLLLVLT